MVVLSVDYCLNQNSQNVNLMELLNLILVI